MTRKTLTYFAPLLLCFLIKSSGGSDSRTDQYVPEGQNPGPDAIAGDMAGLAEYGVNGTQRGLAVGITTCNAGSQLIDFFAMPNTHHPAVAQNLYRMSGGTANNDRFEQVGQSWVKHTYGAKQANSCSFGCQPGGDFTHLGVGCSDTYFSSQSAEQGDLGSRAWINPFTGVFPTTARNHTGHVHNQVSHMMVVESDDLNQTLNAGATYYAELQYITPDEYAWCQTHSGECNMNNNSSYRRYNVSGTTDFTFVAVGSTIRMTPAIAVWTGATVNMIEPEPGVDGRAFVAYKVTGPVAGVYHYEYAVYNQNLDRGIQSFSVPYGCAPPVSNIGFHAPLNHPGFPNDGTLGDAGFSNVPWNSDQSSNAVTWRTETFAQNQNANAIRWGTVYNFRFDSINPPGVSNATIGFFKTGTSVTVAVIGPTVCDSTPSPTATATATATATGTPPNPTPTATVTPSVTPSPSASGTPTPSPTPPAGNGKIAFNRGTGIIYDIYVMDADGSNQINLTNSDLPINERPNWSPDGTRIAFDSNRNKSNYDIYVMDAKGGNVVRLTNDPGGDFNPVWSPDGTKIAFATDRDGDFEVYVMNADGSNQANLTHNPACDGCYGLCWSPDGSKIAFSSDRDGNTEIYVMEADGSNQINLTNRAGGNLGPDWSPDGTKIAFSNYLDPDQDIYVMDADGSNQIRVTHNAPDSDFSPSWSPDGTKMAFTRVVGSNYEIYAMDANGANQINLTNNPAPDYFPDWQRIAATPTPTPTPSPAAQPLNLSTRLLVQTGDSVGIGGFILSGTDPKFVLLRGIGPSLSSQGVPNPLADPVLELHGPPGFETIVNDNWQEGTCVPGGIGKCTICPTNDLESMICLSLDPGPYTAVLRGNDDTAGVGLVEVYDLSTPPTASILANISTRAFVSTDSDIVIAGFILGGNNGDSRVAVRGIGPSLTGLGVPNVLVNPTLELRDSNGALLVANNDWQDDPNQAAELTAAGLALTNQLESGIIRTLSPGVYTALLAGMDAGTGVCLVEVYELGTP